MTVGIVRSNLEDVKSNIKLLFEKINYRPSKNKVFLKPNIVAPQPPETGVITHPVVISALIEIFQEWGYEVVLGESSSVAQNTQRVLELTGYLDLAQHYNIDFVNLEKAKRIECEWKYGKIKLPEIVFTHEYINVAKMKTHIVTKVTLGLKNQKGLLLPSDKRKFHLEHELEEAIIELSNVISPDLTVIDGIIALEGDGPGRAGTPIDMGLLVAGTNVVEVDNIASYLMGFNHGEVNHIPKVDGISTVGIDREQVKREFVRPKDNQVVLGKFRFFNMRACSGCIERFAAGFGISDKSKFTQMVDVLSGQDAEIQCHKHNVVCFGDCTKEFALKNSLPYIGGCPPEITKVSTIPELIKEKEV
ncbi:MAG: DUF362 domain-containing protein [Bacillota bacterium]|nr:DUF362 domain-containing protein [Bacillota bacterium]